MSSFDYLWNLLAPKNEYAPMRNYCRKIWEDIPIERQRAIYRAIKRKIEQKQFVDFNPLYAIQKNANAPLPQPTFLHGKPLFDAMNSHIPLVQVDIPDRAEGRYPVCTREDAERFKLTIIKNF